MAEQSAEATGMIARRHHPISLKGPRPSADGNCYGSTQAKLGACPFICKSYRLHTDVHLTTFLKLKPQFSLRLSERESQALYPFVKKDQANLKNLSIDTERKYALFKGHLSVWKSKENFHVLSPSFEMCCFFPL